MLGSCSLLPGMDPREPGGPTWTHGNPGKPRGLREVRRRNSIRGSEARTQNEGKGGPWECKVDSRAPKETQGDRDISVGSGRSPWKNRGPWDAREARGNPGICVENEGSHVFVWNTRPNMCEQLSDDVSNRKTSPGACTPLGANVHISKRFCAHF